LESDREEASKEDKFGISGDYDEEEEEDEWEGDGDWANENDETEDIKDESTAYLDFLNQEVCTKQIRTGVTLKEDLCRRRNSMPLMRMKKTSLKKRVY
jgi:hypothetical protein